MVAGRTVSIFRDTNFPFRSLQISGLDTNVNFLIDLASHPSFQAGDVHTGFINQHFTSLFPPQKIKEQVIAQAIVALVTNEKNAELRNSIRRNGLAEAAADQFAACDSFRLGASAVREIRLQANENGKIHMFFFLLFLERTISCFRVPV